MSKRFPAINMFIHPQELTPTPSEASSSKIENNNHDKSPAEQLRSNIIDPVAMQLFHCRVDDHVKREDEQSNSKTHIKTRSLPPDPMTPSSGSSSVDVFSKPGLIRNLSGSLSDVKSSEDMSLLARPIPRKVSLQPKKEANNVNH